MTNILPATPGQAIGEFDPIIPLPVVITGEGPIKTALYTLLDPNAALPQYSVLGRITASGLLTLCNPAAVDGSQVPFAISCHHQPDPTGNVVIEVYRAGEFNPAALNWHSGFNTDALRDNAFNGTNPQTIYMRRPRTAF